MARNYTLEKMRLNLRKQNILLSKTTMEVRIEELEDEKARISQNFPLYEAELIQLDQQIAGLEKSEQEEKALNSADTSKE